MHVIHFVKATGIAGAEGHLLSLLPALRTFGIESELVLLEDPRRPQAELRQRMEADGIPVTTLPIHWHIDPALPSRLDVALRHHPFDLLHAHLPHAEFYGEQAMRVYPRKPFVISRHNNDRFRNWLPVRLAFAPSLRRATSIIAISQAVKRFVEDAERVPAAKVVCIPYGLDADAYARRAVFGEIRKELGLGNRPMVLFVGRMTAQKGVDVLLEAFAEVERKYPDAILVLAGDGPLRGRMERLASARKLRSLRFLGWRGDIPNLMADADLVVMPSRWEGFGLAALEAMALAKPVIASSVSSLPEIVVDGKTGFLVPHDNPHALAESINRLLSDTGLAHAFGQAGQMRLAQDFTVERMAEKTASEYRRLLET
jgi:glycosyltransferase involved in cell wall biosynthesis